VIEETEEGSGRIDLGSYEKLFDLTTNRVETASGRQNYNTIGNSLLQSISCSWRVNINFCYKGSQKSVINKTVVGEEQSRHLSDKVFVTIVIGIAVVGLISGTLLGIYVIKQIAKKDSGSQDAISNFSAPTMSELSDKIENKFKVSPQHVTVISVWVVLFSSNIFHLLTLDL
jgi:hypothetical protein